MQSGEVAPVEPPIAAQQPVCLCGGVCADQEVSDHAFAGPSGLAVRLPSTAGRKRGSRDEWGVGDSPVRL